jgi:hypothetical protein
MTFLLKLFFKLLIKMETPQNNNLLFSINREAVLTKYNFDTIEKVWEAFCKSIATNYQLGKGTSIHKFGTFTFTNTEVNLEGTTNQFNRDNKARKPIFIVSNDFVERLKPGIYGTNGLIYYTQKVNNNISHIKINYSQIAFTSNVAKEDCLGILEHYIKLIGDNIIQVNLI